MDDIIKSVPIEARQAMAEVLAEISANLADPKNKIEPYRMRVLYPHKARLWGKATRLFTRHFLPLVVPGDWRPRRMDAGHWSGDDIPDV